MTKKITVDSILWAYRLLLNREPENLDIINDKLNNLKNNRELVQELINSAEFADQQKKLNSIKIEPENLPQVNNNETKTVAYYEQAIKKNPYIAENVYLKLKKLQEKSGNREKAIAVYQQWIAREYLIEHNHKIIYCPIAKNACTLFKDVLIKISDEREKYLSSDLKMHSYIDRNRDKFIVEHFTYLNNPDYFKFIIIRNPFKRLVSTYGDKFVKRSHKTDPHAIPVIKEVQQYLGIEFNLSTSITFSQFVDYLSRTDDEDLDSHWRPQSVYLAQELVNFDYIGQFERLDVVIKVIEQKLNIKIDANVSEHRIDYSESKNQEKYHHWSPQNLSKLKVVPTAKEFYTPEIEEKIAIRYAQDIAIYEEQFDTKITPFCKSEKPLRLIDGQKYLQPSARDKTNLDCQIFVP